MPGSPTHSVEENASLLIHEVSHLLRDHEGRKKAAGIRDHRRWNTAGDCEINDDLHAEGLPLPGDPPLPAKYGLQSGKSAETYYKQLPAPPRADGTRDGRAISEPAQDCGSGAHGERRFWELPADDGGEGGVPGVDRIKAELVRREVARRIEKKSPSTTATSRSRWRRWARATLAPKVDYMATIRHAVRRALRDSTLGRYDRTYRRPHRRQACYGEFIMASFYQPRPRPGFLIDTSGSMEDSQLARAVSELGGLTRQLGYGADVSSRAATPPCTMCRKVFSGTPIELYGGGGTDMGVGLRAFIERKIAPIDLLVIVSDCHTPWPARRSAVSGDHDPRWRRRTAAVGKSRRQQSDYDRGRRRTTGREPDIAKERQLGMARSSIARDEPVEAAAADDPAGLAARLGQPRRVGILDGHARVRGALASARGSSPPRRTTSSPCSISRTAMPRRRSFSRVNASPIRAGALNVAFNVWCGVLLIAVAAWLLWELWSAVAPKPITDDFLKLLDDSFGRDWRNPRTWPWARLGWAYGFTLVGATVGPLRRAAALRCRLVVETGQGADAAR